MPDQTISPNPSSSAPADGSTPVDWAAHIPQDVATEKVWDSYRGKPIGDVLKSFVDSHKYATGAIKLPTEKDKPDEAAAKIKDIYGKLGRPESPDKYTIKTPQVPDGVSWDVNRETAFKTMAHQLNLTNQQVQGLLDWYGKDIGESLASREQGMMQSRKDAEAKLRHEWGSAYDKNVSLAKQALTALASDTMDKEEAESFLDAIAQTGLGNNPAFVKIMARVGSEFSEDTLVRGDSTTSDDSVQKQIHDWMSKPEYTDPQHPRHEIAVLEVQKLFQLQANPMRRALQEA